MIESLYDVSGEGGRPLEVKREMNAAVCEALCELGGGAEECGAWVRRDPRHVLVVIDGPRLDSTAALMAAIPALRMSQQIIVPQVMTSRPCVHTHGRGWEQQGCSWCGQYESSGPPGQPTAAAPTAELTTLHTRPLATQYDLAHYVRAINTDTAEALPPQ
jgi:hypothetical protein|eukprot:COSAG01_NODE_27351_length_688_cov_0.689304_1_plen_160_part_00